MSTHAAPALLASVRPDTRTSAAWTVVRFSLAVTALGALVAAVLRLAIGADFLLSFVYVRWFVVLVLLAAPLAHRTVLRRAGVALPFAMQTPLTALVLTVESICFDILSAQLH